MVDTMLSKMKKYIDVIIPRGGKNLVKRVQEFSNVPSLVTWKVFAIHS